MRAPGSSSPLPLPLSLSRPGRPPQPGGRARVGRPAAGRAGGVGCERQRILPPGGPHRRGRSLHLGPGHGAARGWGVRKKTEGGEQNCELTRCMRTRAGSWATATRRRATRPLWLPPWRAIRLLRLRAGRRALRPAGPPRNSLTRCCLARLSPLQSHTLVVTSSGECFAFGSNKHGQLGTGKYSKPKDGVEDGSALPLPCATPPGVASVAAGAEFSLFLCSDGALLSCGLPQHGVLGHGTDHEYNSADGSVKLVYAPQPTPKAVASFASAGLKVAKVAAGHAHCVAIDDKGHVWTWGNGNYGCLVRFFPFPSAQSSMFSLIYLPPPPGPQGAEGRVRAAAGVHPGGRPQRVPRRRGGGRLRHRVVRHRGAGAAVLLGKCVSFLGERVTRNETRKLCFARWCVVLTRNAARNQDERPQPDVSRAVHGPERMGALLSLLPIFSLPPFIPLTLNLCPPRSTSPPSRRAPPPSRAAACPSRGR